MALFSQGFFDRRRARGTSGRLTLQLLLGFFINVESWLSLLGLRPPARSVRGSPTLRVGVGGSGYLLFFVM